MPKRDWDEHLKSVGFLLLGSLLIGSIIYAPWVVSGKLTEERVEAEKSAAYHEQYAIDRIEKNCAGLSVGRALNECIHIEVQASHDHNRSEQNIVHQRDMAIWAMVMAGVSVLALIITAVGVAFVAKTLNATKDAVLSANRTNNIMLSQQRPWLGLKNFTIKSKTLYKSDNSETAGIFIEFEVCILNSGATPAQSATIKTAFLTEGQVEKIRYSGDDDEVSRFTNRFRKQSVSGSAETSVAPGETATISEQQFALPFNGSPWGQHFLIMARYRTKVTGIWETKVCWMIKQVRLMNNIGVDVPSEFTFDSFKKGHVLRVTTIKSYME